MVLLEEWVDFDMESWKSEREILDRENMNKRHRNSPASYLKQKRQHSRKTGGNNRTSEGTSGKEWYYNTP